MTIVRTNLILLLVKATDFAEFFSARERALGAEYEREGRVAVFAMHSPHLVDFMVEGAENYLVQIDIDEDSSTPTADRIQWSCECPAYVRENICKHVWAVLKYAEAKGILPPESESVTKEVAVQSAPLYFVLTNGNGVEFARPGPADGSWTRTTATWTSMAYDNDLPHHLRQRVADVFRMITGGHMVDSLPMYFSEANQLIESLVDAGRVLAAEGETMVPVSRARSVRGLDLALDVNLDQTLHVVNFVLRNDAESTPLAHVRWRNRNLVLINGTLRRVNRPDLLDSLRQDAELRLTTDELGQMLESLYERFDRIPFALPEEMRYEQVPRGLAHTRVVIEKADSGRLGAKLTFLYGTKYIAVTESTERVFDHDKKRVYIRDRSAERRALARFLKYFNRKRLGPDGTVRLPERTLQAFVTFAFKARWEVVAFDRVVATSKSLRLRMSSGIDWFDLEVDLRFANGERLLLPDLLREIRHGNRMVTLADGTLGVLDESVVERIRHLGLGARVVDGKLRLSRVQALFHATSLADDPCFDGDKKFATVREVARLSANPPLGRPGKGFRGHLRPYQSRGLGWLEAMAKREVGCVLADDMGLGKTVCVLALLTKPRRGPALIVVPKTLIDNWCREAATFSPSLNVFAHAGPDRVALEENFKRADVIVTSYHGLRVDIDRFKNLDFEYLILDEAHHVKNPEADVHRACRLITARRRIALTGTPIENSLGDLFAILSIVAPGLISKEAWVRFAAERDAASLGSVARALRPFLLRRTKAQVLGDLPAKTEQIIYCEMSPAERRAYAELKTHFWAVLKNRVDHERIDIAVRGQIFAALVRLRQAACHRNLLQASPPLSSSKFDVLLQHLTTTIADGHKVLVFSSFARLLVLLGAALEKTRHCLRIHRWNDAGPGRDHRPLQAEEWSAGVFVDAEDGRRGPQSDRSKLRLHTRPVVEPRRGEPSDRSRSPYGSV